MLGGIVGDIIGSVYEWDRIKTKDFPLFSEGCRFTDDTVLTFATAKVLLDGGSYADAYADFAIRYPNRGYGGRFRKWMKEWDDQECETEMTSHPAPPPQEPKDTKKTGRKPYNSLGNGSAMRVGPIGWVCREGSSLLWEARKSAQCTHNHPEGIRGAQAVAMAVHLARIGRTREIIRDEMTDFFRYELSRPLDDIRPGYGFDVTCPGTVPQAIQCFLESADFEDAIRNAVSLGGDSDTLACITGSIAEAYYKGVPEDIATAAIAFLPQEFIDIVVRFKDRFVMPNHQRTKEELWKNAGAMIKREADASMSIDPCEVWRSNPGD